MSHAYKLVYLSSARADMLQVSRYIAQKLSSPQAAVNLLKSIDESITLLQQFPYTHPIIHLKKVLNKEFRILPVKNFAVIYVVDEDKKIVEIQAIIYAKRDFKHKDK